jgi:hypothetical protein
MPAATPASLPFIPGRWRPLAAVGGSLAAPLAANGGSFLDGCNFCVVRTTSKLHPSTSPRPLGWLGRPRRPKCTLSAVGRAAAVEQRGTLQNAVVASYSVNPDAVGWAQHLIDSRQYVLESDWGKSQPRASQQNAFLKSHSWEEYARWHLGLTDGVRDRTKARYAFVYGDFTRLHRMGLIACMYRAAEWRHKEIELAAHELLQRLDNIQP